MGSELKDGKLSTQPVVRDETLEQKLERLERENASLRAENASLRLHREILRRATAFFAKIEE